MGRLKIGVIGLGTIAAEHIKAYENNDAVELAAFCDVVQGRAELQAVHHSGALAYANYLDMLADPDVDAVSICAPNDQHAAIALAALHAGKHVLVEKPMAKTVAEAESLASAVSESGNILQVGYVRRFSPNALAAKKAIDAGDLGEVYFAKASILRSAGNPGGWFSNKAVSGGGPLIDLGVHVIDICWYLMGMPEVASVSGATFAKLGSREHLENFPRYRAADQTSAVNSVEDLASALIKFANGAVLYVDASYSIHGRSDTSIKLFGSLGGAELEPELLFIGESHNQVVHVKPQSDSLTFDVEAAFQNEIDYFVDSCLGRVPADATAEQGLELTRIISAIYESAESGREVVVAEAALR
jgi:predicted dehydrogenase